LEEEANEWHKKMGSAAVVQNIQFSTDRNGNLVLAYFYMLPEGFVEPKATEAEPESVAEPEEPVFECLCPHCSKVCRPGTVPRGPNKGKMKCPECGRVFEKEIAETDAAEVDNEQ
jgi:hypothetical protein